jgi:hypothetical protein
MGWEEERKLQELEIKTLKKIDFMNLSCFSE